MRAADARVEKKRMVLEFGGEIGLWLECRFEFSVRNSRMPGPGWVDSRKQN